HAVGYGQLSPQLSLLVAGAFAALGVRRAGWAGTLVGAAACLKSFPVLLGGYLLLRRQWYAGLTACLMGLLLLATTVLALGWEAHWAYVTGVIPAQRYWFANVSNLSITGFFTRLLTPNLFTI